jgi:hypothetical protein
MFGSKTKTSQATSQAQSAINSSGWSVGGSTASGGSLEAVSGYALPRGALYSAAACVLAWLYFKNKKGK